MSAPKKTRPPAIVGCPYIDAAFGRPNAHFNLRLGTCAAVMPAAFADWKRALVASGPQPFHAAPAEGSVSFAFAAQWFGIDFGSPAGTLPSFRPPTNSAKPRFTRSVRSAWACVCAGVGLIVIAAYTVSGASLRSASISGACSAPVALATPGLR